MKKGNVRSFVETKRKIGSAIFQDETRKDDLSPALLKNARKTGSLNLSGRNLINIPAKVWNINKVDKDEAKVMSVSMDNTSEEKWWEFVELQKLILANNYITEIPKEVSELFSLQVLDIHDNQLERISENIGVLEELQKLDISHNKLRQLPNTFFNLRRLNELKINHNQLEELQTDIGYLSCLRFLDISNNNFTQIPADLGFLSQITNLNISNNKLKEIPRDLNGLTGLRTFDASENLIEKIPPSMFETMLHLEIIYLKNNRITKIPEITNCRNLKELHMAHNKVTHFKSAYFAPTKIQLLDFRSNKIFSMDVNKEDMELVDRLYLDNNDISDIPNDLAMLPAIKAISLEGNPLRGIRIDIIRRGTQEILKYLKGKIEFTEEDFSSQEVIKGPASGQRNQKMPLSKIPQISQAAINRGTMSSEDLNIDPYKLKNSHVLNLSSKNIVALDSDVFDIATASKVTIIDLSKNQISVLPVGFGNTCELLTELKLDFNRFLELPSSITRCTRLNYLSFQNNLIENLNFDFSCLKNLREINFSFNKLKTIPSSLYEVENLEIILAENNKIEDVDPNKILKLKRLAVLDLKNNNLAKVPPELGLLKLRSLSIEGNAFKVPNYQILSKGTPAILQYLQNRIVSNK